MFKFLKNIKNKIIKKMEDILLIKNLLVVSAIKK
jgi:hypothetical protein